MPTALLDDRAILRVGGPDARAFLQGLLTSDVDTLAAGRVTWAALLSPQGKVLWDMLVHAAADGAVLLDVEAARADELTRRLAMYRLRRAVTIERTGEAVLAAWDQSPTDWPVDGRLPALGARRVATIGAGDASAAAWHAHRLRLGVPEGAADLGIDKTLWLEANAAELGGVSFTKGCYIGQENTARMHHKDKLRRRLLPVALTAHPGEARAIEASGRAAGELRSFSGERGIAWMRLELAREPLTLAGAAVSVAWPEWLAA